LRTERRVQTELLRAFAGTSELGDCFLVLLLCTCTRWDRVTAKLIAQLEVSGLLGSADLDELAESFVSEEVNVECSVGWLAPEWLQLEPGPGGSEPVRLPEGTPTTRTLTVEPPLRRWAAARALRGRPERLGDLLDLSRRLPKLHGYAVLHGLLDAAGALAETDRRRLVARGLGTGQAPVRLAALDLLCADKGPDAARRRARSDANARVRAWRPPSTEPAAPLG
jgi:hypothetical protein